MKISKLLLKAMIFSFGTIYSLENASVTNDRAKLHSESYSQLLDYYNSLNPLMNEMRKDVQSYILDGVNQKAFDINSVGPCSLAGPQLNGLSKEASILDVGCGPGDCLVLMQEKGFKNLTGIDIAPLMIEKASTHKNIDFVCGDFLRLDSKTTYDLVHAQAFVHLFPKNQLKTILKQLINLSNRRIYFSTTIHDVPREGLEAKEGVYRYRSRYTLQEILTTLRDLLAEESDLSFHYFFLKDPLGKYWINVVIEKNDVNKIFLDDGIVVYKQFIDPQKISHVLGEVDRLAQVSAVPGTLLRYDTETVFDRVENFIPYCSNDLREVFCSPKILDIVASLIGEQAILFKDKINFKMPGSGQFVPHQDAAAGWDRYGNTQLTVAISLDGSNEDNGALYFAPGAHKKGLLSSLKKPLSQQTIAQLNWQIVCTEPGDALFFGGLVPHYSNANNSHRPRRMAFLTYMPSKYGDNRAAFFEEKRKRQPPIDEREASVEMVRDEFGKLILKSSTEEKQ